MSSTLNCGTHNAAEKREEITKKAARDPLMRLFEQQQLTDNTVCSRERIQERRQCFGPRRAGWWRKGLAPRREEGRAQRTDRRDQDGTEKKKQTLAF